METKLLKKERKREKKREQKEYNCLQKGSYLTLHDQIWKIFSCLYDAKNGELFLSVRTKHIEIPNTFLNLVSAANTAHTHTHAHAKCVSWIICSEVASCAAHCICAEMVMPSYVCLLTLKEAAACVQVRACVNIHSHFDQEH